MGQNLGVATVNRFVYFVPEYECSLTHWHTPTRTQLTTEKNHVLRRKLLTSNWFRIHLGVKQPESREERPRGLFSELSV